MIKMPPATQKVLFISYKIKDIGKDVLSGWIIQHVMEFIHSDRFNWCKSNFGTGFSRSSELVVDVGYPRIGKFWSHLINSCWCTESMGDGTTGGIEIGEEVGMAEAGEEL